MAEYIEREKALKLLEDMASASAKLYPGLMTAYSQIKTAPSADVRPERHGEWNELSLDDQDEGMYICSECKSIEFMPEECDIYAYCPNCGAKMDGKDGESDG